MKNPYIYKILSVDKIIDGDTVDLTLDLGFGITKKDRYRLDDIDTPESYRPHSRLEYNYAISCKNYLRDLLSSYSSTLFIQCSKVPEIYGRYGGTIFYQENKTVNSKIQTFMDTFKITKADIDFEETFNELLNNELLNRI